MLWLSNSTKNELVAHFGAHTNTQDNNHEKLRVQNIEYTRELGKICKKKGHRLFFASSSAVYGDELKPNLNSLNNPYARSKLISEHDLQDIFGGSKGLKILRLFNVFGPGELHKGKMISLPSRFILDALDNQRIVIWQDKISGKLASRDFIYVRDLCEIVSRLVGEGNGPIETLDIGTGKSRYFSDVAKVVQNLVPCEVIYEKFPKEVDMKNYQFYTKAPSAITKRFQNLILTDFERSIQETFNSYALDREKPSNLS